jgi:hypothetical protein
MEIISWLESWYAAQCNGDWEHTGGVRVTTIDNPGWLVTVSLVGTQFESVASDCTLKVTGTPPSSANGNVGGPEWMECKIAKAHFVGAGDAGKLGLILEQFRDWVVGH